MPRGKRVNKEDQPNPNGKKYNIRFGWCVDGYHDMCRVGYVDWNKIEQMCICDCHKGEI